MLITSIPLLANEYGGIFCCYHEEVHVKKIPPYFKNQSVPIVSYSYTNSIGRKIVNYKEALQDINIEE
jgi:hypothetical protein